MHLLPSAGGVSHRDDTGQAQCQCVPFPAELVAHNTILSRVRGSVVDVVVTSVPKKCKTRLTRRKPSLVRGGLGVVSLRRGDSLGRLAGSQVEASAIGAVPVQSQVVVGAIDTVVAVG